MTKKESIIEYYYDQEWLFADGFDDAIIGVHNRINGENKVVYSQKLCVETLMLRDGMSLEEALEYIDFNVTGAYVGNKTPVFVDDMIFEDDY